MSGGVRAAMGRQDADSGCAGSGCPALNDGAEVDPAALSACVLIDDLLDVCVRRATFSARAEKSLRRGVVERSDPVIFPASVSAFPLDGKNTGTKPVDPHPAYGRPLPPRRER